MIRILLGLALALAFVAPACADGDGKATLGIGSPAPKLDFKEFAKGEPVKSFEKGNVYVLEFWATWCPPCVEAIPHVTALQKQNPKVVFIGVNVGEGLDKVKPFVEKFEAKMDYRVAIDNGNDAGRGAMAKTWLDAAGQEGIPCTMIVNGDGVVAWIGHPMKMDKPLATVVSGKWNLQAALAEAKAEKEAAKAEEAELAKFQAVIPKLRAAIAKGPEEGLKALDEVIDATPGFEKRLGLAKFSMLEKLQKLDQQITYGERLVDKVLEEPEPLNEFAWKLIEPDRKDAADPRLQKLALKAALKADTASEGKSHQIADTLGRAYFVTGDKAKALSTQERTVKLAKGTADEAELKGRLEEYKK